MATDYLTRLIEVVYNRFNKGNPTKDKIKNSQQIYVFTIFDEKGNVIAQDIDVTKVRYRYENSKIYFRKLK